MQDVNFCLMQCLIGTDGYTCRPGQEKNDNFMEWSYVARFSLPEEKKM